MSYQGLAPVAPPNKPGVIGIAMGIVLAVVGWIAGGAIIAMSVVGSVQSLTAAPTLYADGTDNQVDLVGGQSTGIWTPYTSYISCRVTDPTGANVSVAGPTISTHINNYYLLGNFTPAASGTYTVNCGTSMPTGYTPESFKIAPMVSVNNTVVGALLGVLVIIVLFFAGIVLLVVTISRRSRWDSQYGPSAMAMDQPDPSPFPPDPLPR
ncbi:MAG: hypothetical protein FWD63_01855 [Propionibacteriaceae bacterium]|nr:hypothetical protein [Propionibacteriaceae bacterium]